MPRSHISLFSLNLLVLALLGTAGSPGHADEVDDAIQAALKSFENVASLFGLTSLCPQFASMDADSCEQADTLGLGVACPPLTAVDVSQSPVESCSANFADVVKGELNAAGIARLKASDIDRYVLRATFRPLSQVAQHLHDQGHAPAGTCVESWIKRKDRVQMFAAIYSSSDVSLAVPIPNPGVPLSGANNQVTQFTAEVGNEQGAAVQWEGIICGSVTHGDPRTCGAEEDEDDTGTHGGAEDESGTHGSGEEESEPTSESQGPI